MTWFLIACILAMLIYIARSLGRMESYLILVLGRMEKRREPAVGTALDGGEAETVRNSWRMPAATAEEEG